MYFSSIICLCEYLRGVEEELGAPLPQRLLNHTAWAGGRGQDPYPWACRIAPAA